MSDSSKKPSDLVLDVVLIEVHHPDCPHHPDNQKSGDGPTKVTSDAYRSGWDTIFGDRVPVGEA